MESVFPRPTSTRVAFLALGFVIFLVGCASGPESSGPATPLAQPAEPATAEPATNTPDATPESTPSQHTVSAAEYIWFMFDALDATIDAAQDDCTTIGANIDRWIEEHEEAMRSARSAASRKAAAIDDDAVAAFELALSTRIDSVVTTLVLCDGNEATAGLLDRLLPILDASKDPSETGSPDN